MPSKRVQSLIKKLAEAKDATFVIKREPSNYELFFELYKKVGYVSKGVDFEEWKETTTKAWNAQDDLSPFSCTGGLYNGKLVSSLGTLPISQQVVYGHSFCMLKTLPGILTMVPQMLHSTSRVEDISNAGYYAGSYKNSSRFTSKLHSISDSTGQLCIQSLDLSPASTVNNNKLSKYELSELKEHNDLPEAVLHLLNLFGTPHTSLDNVHQIKHYMVSSEDRRPIAVVIYHNSLPGFTAIDIFDRSWIVMLDNQDGADLCQFLRTLPEFKNQTFELLNSDYVSTPRYSGPDHVMPRQWVFTPKAYVNQSLPFLLQTIYALVDKFPEEDVVAVCEELLGEKLSNVDSIQARPNTFFNSKADEHSSMQNAVLKAKL